MAWLFITFYASILSFILIYSMVQLRTTFLYLQSKKQAPSNPLPALQPIPFVTIQVPIYNEKYVINRILKALSELDYPKNKFEIQVLDDSTDETSDLIRSYIQSLPNNELNIQHLQRGTRSDFKAGALGYGLKKAKGTFIAVFDADFIPPKDFLQQTIPYFNHQRTGVVQTRWGHINERYSLLTQLQAYALNAHFSIEQSGRSFKNHFINFNGTAGVWRKATIENAGGWAGDTLTEDLDLSYRAQMKGWKFVYLEQVVTPAELPIEINALKSQQFRWAKGAAECTRKNLRKVLSSKDIKFSTKFHSIFHLLNSFNWVCLFVSAILLLPFQNLLFQQPKFSSALGFMVIYHLTFFALFLYYFVANRSFNKKPIKNTVLFCLSYPAFLTLSMGISLYNTIGVLEGYIGKKSAFIRTPKFNAQSTGSVQPNSYVRFNFNYVTLLESIALVYFGYTTYMTYYYKNFVALPFSVMMTIGIGTVLFYSSFHLYRSKAS